MSLPSMDFETYSDAGYVFRDGKWKSITGGAKSGLSAVGAIQYSLHPSTEVLSLAYDLKDGKGVQLWIPDAPPPTDLFHHILSGGLIESWNSAFEHHIWNNVCHARMGWPKLSYLQQRDPMAKARAYSLPGSLEKAGKVLNPSEQKDPEGKRLLKKFSMPRQPTKLNKSTRVYPHDDPIDASKLYTYNIQDVVAEDALSDIIPDLIPDELEFWLNTQVSNYRGVGVRKHEVEDCIAILEQAYTKYNDELDALTGGEVKEASKVAQLLAWCERQGVRMVSLDDASIKTALAQPIPPQVRRVLEIRSAIGSAGVKKVYAMERMATPEGRICDLFIYHGARTGRDTGSDVQPQNLVKAGPKIQGCGGCNKPSGKHHKDICPHCGGSLALLSYPMEWGVEAVDTALEAMATRSLEWVEHLFGDAVLTISGCIRGLLVAGEGKDLICSDYSAIEAVVLAALAGEQWRLDTFHAKEDIYLKSASTITGKTMEEYKQYHKETGNKHPDRQKIGKVAELASGYAGWVGAWKNFGADKLYDDAEIKRLIMAWRSASPAVVEFWGGQSRSKPWEQGVFEPYGTEGMVVKAILSPGTRYECGLIGATVLPDDTLRLHLPSGRDLVYHRPRLSPSSKNQGLFEISYEGYNSNPQMGAIGWVRINTYAGRLVENCISLGTKVLTEKGWVPIEDVTKDLKVHDGVEFVNQEGFQYNGIQHCTRIDGVYMTLDHKVLTDDGWKEAKEKPRPYRPTLRDADGFMPIKNGWQKVVLVLCMRLRKDMRKMWERRNQGREEGKNTQLWVHDLGAYCKGEKDPRNVKAPSIRGLEVNEGQVSPPLTSSMGKLWGKRHNCLPKLGRKVREFLGGYGTYLPKRIRNRQEGQQPWVLLRKLSLGSPESKCQKQKEFSLYKYPMGKDYLSRSSGEVRDWEYHDTEPNTNGVAGGVIPKKTGLVEKMVGDLINCGPRQRFVVMGKEGPFIVHNCVQAVSRDIMRDAVNNLERVGYPVVLRVHDEIVAEVPKGWGSIEEFEFIMATLPKWAEGWPVRAAGGWRGDRYRKD